MGYKLLYLDFLESSSQPDEAEGYEYCPIL